MNNPNLTLVGTGDFSLITGATTVPANESAYDANTAMFGNVKEVTILNETEVKEHFGSYRGIRILDRSVTTQIKKGYKLKLDEFDRRALQMLFYGAAGTDTTSTPVYETVTPFALPQSLQGFARLRIWDSRSQTHPRMIHKDFFCIVRFEGDFSLGDDFTEYELKVDVISPVGTVYLRKDS